MQPWHLRTAIIVSLLGGLSLCLWWFTEFRAYMNAGALGEFGYGWLGKTGLILAGLGASGCVWVVHDLHLRMKVYDDTGRWYSGWY